MVDDALVPHLREVAHAPQQAVGHARRAAGARGDLERGVPVDLDAEDAGRAADDGGELLDRVVVEPLPDAEPVAQRRREQARARGGADERERLHVHADAARAGPSPIMMSMSKSSIAG